MSGDRRIGIHFDINADEVKKLDQISQTMARFNQNMGQLKQSAGSVANAMNKMNQAQNQVKNGQQSLFGMMKNFDQGLKSQHFTINALSNAQNALSKRLERFGRNVKVNMQETGKFTATLTNFQNQTVKLSGSFDQQTNKLTNLKRSVTTTAMEVDKMRQKQKELNREMERMRGKNITNLLPSNRAFNAQTDALAKYSTVIKGSIDRNGRFTQTLVSQKGELIKVTGYYNKAKHSLVEYNREVGKASKAQLGQAGFSRDAINRIGMMAESMRGLNRQTLAWNEALSISALRMVQWSISGTAIFGTQRALRAMIDTIIEVDTQMTELKKVMDEETNFPAMLESSIQLANTLGRTITEINEAFIEFGRQGLSEEQVDLMARATTIMANVGDIDAGQAASKLTGIITVFRKDFSEATDVVDRFNEVQNNYATTVGILTDSVKKAGGTAQAFGVDLEEVIGHTTAIGEATRETGNVIGNGLKTIYSRMTTMNGAIGAIEGVGVRVFDPMTGSVRRVSDVLDELAGVWHTLSDSQRQNIGVQVAGRYQLTRFLALMDNYQTALNATETSTKSWGSSMKENQTWMESIQARLNKFTAALQELAIKLGEAGVGKAFVFLVEAGTKLIQGFTDIVDTFGAFSFAIPVLVAGVTAISWQFRKLKMDTDLLRSGLVPINPAIAAMGTTMGMSTTSAAAMSGAIGKLTGGIRALAAATLTNPLFWIPMAISGIVTLVGHFKQLERRQEELASTTKTAKQEYNDFLAAIKSGEVDTFQIEKYNKQIEDMKAAQKDLTQIINENSDSLKTQSTGYSTIGISARHYQMTKEELTEAYANETMAMKVLSDEQETYLASMGLMITNKTTIADLTDQLSEREEKLSESISKAEEALKKQREEAVLPTAQAYYELGDSIDDQSSAMENALDITDKLMKQMEEQRGIIELLSGVKDKDKVQTQLLENAYAYWADMLGITEDELKKHPELIGKQIDKQKELLELSGKVADGTATAEEKKRAQQLLSAENAEKTAKREANAEKEAQEIQREVVNKKMKKLEEYDRKMEQAMSSTSNSVSSSSKVILERMGKQGSEFDRTGTKYDQMKDIIKAGSTQSSSSVAQMSSSTIMNLNGVKKKTDETKSAWEKLKEAFSKKITGFASLSIKGIFSGLFGAGGNIDGDKLKEAVMSSGGGSIAGGGYGGLRFTSGFGSRVHPISGKRSFHAGIDLAGPMGTPIRARHGGTVISSGWAGGYGNMVSILGTNGLEYRYAHNSANYVKPGQFVPAGMTIAAMGSTGDSTGSHLHFEVRRGGQAINPTAYYHSGGIVDGKPKHNEVDARLQVGEMVINQSQQKTLFDFLNKKNGNDTFTGMGGPTHTVRYGDTLSELAMKYYGNAYSGGLEKLLKLNPQIKDKNRIYVGQKINIPGSSSSSGSSGSKPKPAPKPKPMFKDKDAAQSYLTSGLNTIDLYEHLGIRNSDYRVSNLTNAKYREAYRMTGQKNEYNKMVFDELSQFTDYNKAKQFFDKADVFLSSADKAKTLKNIMKNIGENVLAEIADNTDKWLNNFNKGVKEANQQVQDMIDLSNQVTNRKIQEKENNFVSGYVADMLASLGVAPEVDPRDALQQQADELMNKINQRAEESALLEYRLNSGELQGRLGELSGYRSQLEAQMKAIENQFKSRGINDQSLISQAQQPLRDRLAEITAEYEELQIAIKNGSTTLAENKAELQELADQYKKLQDELNKVDSKREFTDIWGNVVRDAEGQVKMITDQGQLLMNTYENIRQEIEGIQQAATGGAMSDVISPILAQLKQAVTGFQPQVNTEITTGAADTSSSSETRTYEANTNSIRNVQYHVHTGVALASEHELREFAMKIKDLIDEEEGRG